jgi:hypothetical protein
MSLPLGLLLVLGRRKQWFHVFATITCRDRSSSQGATMRLLVAVDDRWSDIDTPTAIVPFFGSFLAHGRYHA